MASGKRGALSSILGLHEEFERLVHGIIETHARTTSHHGWVPPADVFVSGGCLVVRFEVAGVRREDIELTYKDGELTVRGTRLECEAEPKDGYWQMEIPHGHFERSVRLPLPVDPDRIDAVYRNGMLEVRMPILAAQRAPNTVRIEPDVK